MRILTSLFERAKEAQRQDKEENIMGAIGEAAEKLDDMFHQAQLNQIKTVNALESIAESLNALSRKHG